MVQQIWQGAPVWRQAASSVAADHTRIAVDVTFLRMGRRPVEPAPGFAPGDGISHLTAPTVGFYRYLYGTVGHDYCWWLRRVATDAELAALLTDSHISLHVLYRDGAPGGFFELDSRHGGEVNISYFGLLPHLVGKGVGQAFLRAAIDQAWSRVLPRPGLGIRVNTCTADHPRALGSYLRAGFKPIRTVRELWNIPDSLGLPIPDALRA
ncbi:GNAT family N-acetyltransferase [Lichenicoccus sp.]|uniref:GNAT family N-acetyltransferase n=1 Tax=Lichenicoccus sp. TaxID=2781899 RepID=UPI003D1392EF